MKSFFTIFTLLVFICSCTKEYQPRNIDTIVIKKITIDSISIRAIIALDSSRVYFAASDGSVGFKSTDENSNSNIYIKYQDSITPNFRSLATNGTDYYAMSIGSPALLYNLSRDTLVYKEEHKKAFYDSMKFFDKRNGIAMGDPTEDCLSIILTNDGGYTWSKIPCNKIPKTVEGEAAFAASNTSIKVLGKTAWIATGGTQARIFKSIDYGKTWEVFNTPIIQGEGSQGIYSIDFSDQNNGIIIGGDYLKPKANLNNKAITKNGGKTWTLVSDGQNPNYKSCVQYVPGTDGKEVFAVGKTGISYSNDSGITWNEVSKDEYYTIQFVDRNVAWLSGNEKIGKLILH